MAEIKSPSEDGVGLVRRMRHTYEQLAGNTSQNPTHKQARENSHKSVGKKTLLGYLAAEGSIHEMSDDEKPGSSDHNHNNHPRRRISERRSKLTKPPSSPRPEVGDNSDVQPGNFSSIVCGNIDLCVPNRTALIVQKFQAMNSSDSSMETHHSRRIMVHHSAHSTRSEGSHHSKRIEGHHSTRSEGYHSTRHLTPEASASDSSTNHESDVTGEDSSDLFDDDDDENSYNVCPERPAVDGTPKEDESPSEPILDKWQRIVKEFVDTEKSYVQKLQLISQDFQKELRLRNMTEKMLPDNIPPLIFSNIETIYMFHKVHLMPRMEECTVRSQDESPKQYMGDVFKKHAPFLKMYTEYVKNFDNAMQTFQLWQGKSNKFAKFVQEFQQRLKCGHLTIQNHMLEPIQRIPRYELLLREYLKHMPDDFCDREDAKGALELITEAAAQINEVRKFMEKTAKLMEIQGLLLQENSVDLMSPGRELVKEGKLMVLSNKTKEYEERHLYLFNDMILLCKTITQPPRLKYKVSSKVNIAKLEVFNGVPTPTSLTIMAQEDIIEIHFGNIDEKDEWITSIQDVSVKWKRLRNTRTSSTESTDDNKTIGQWAPVFINFQDASSCMLCMNEFTTLRRRHHCHCCGSVVCTRCSNFKVVLRYNQLEKRVCSLCFTKLELDAQRRISSGAESEEASSPTELS